MPTLLSRLREMLADLRFQFSEIRPCSRRLLRPSVLKERILVTFSHMFDRILKTPATLRKRASAVAAAAVCGSFCAFSAHAAGVDLSGTIFERVGLEANIDPLLLYSVALCESAYNPNPALGSVAPYPWVLRTPKAPFYGDGPEDSKAELRKMLSVTNSVDVGMMQINVKWHRHRVRAPEDLLDPVTNLRVGAEILNELFARYPHDAVKAIGYYHSRTPERARGYGRTVWRVFSTLNKSRS